MRLQNLDVIGGCLTLLDQTTSNYKNHNMNRAMKKVIIVFCLFLLPFAFVFPQTEEVSDCVRNIENIFKAHDLKIKYETVRYIYKYENGGFTRNDSFLNNYFKLIRGFPYWEEQKDSILSVKPGESVRVVKWIMSKEEMSRYLEQLNYTPEEAYKEYSDFIRDMKLENEIYLKCIEVELAKEDASEYAEKQFKYSFIESQSSLMPPMISKLDLLRIYKEFVINYDQDILPNGLTVNVFQRCGCMIPPHWFLLP